MLVLACTGLSADVSSIREACHEVRQQMEQEQKVLEALHGRIGDERSVKRRSMAEIQERIKIAESRMLVLEEESETITTEISRLNQEVFENNHKFKRLNETIAFHFHEFYRLYRQTFPAQPAFPEKLDTLDDGGNVLDVLTSGFRYYQDYFAKASSIEIAESEFYDDSGTLVSARVLRTGLVGGAFWKDNGAGIAYYKSGSDRLHLRTAGLSRTERQLLEAASGNRTGVVPVHLDISQGMALNQLRLKKNWKEFFESGGFVMYPLILIGIVAVLMILERIVTFTFFSISFSSMRRKIIESLCSKDYDAAGQLAGSHLGPSRRFWRRAVELVKNKADQVDEAFQHLILSEIPAIERFLSSLAVFAAVCPLLGLLGTVGGMIKTFEVITLYGTGNSALLSQGISEALVTTQVGLILAIPILLAHSALSKKAKSIIGAMDQTVALIEETINKK